MKMIVNETSHAGNNEYSQFMYISVSFGQNKVSALLDSGSAINMLSQSMYEAIPPSLKSEIRPLIGTKLTLANNF